MNISDDIVKIKGVGNKTSELLSKCGIFTILDLLLYFPRNYMNINYCRNVEEMKKFNKVIIKCKVNNFYRDILTKNRKTITIIDFTDGINIFKAKWFNQPYIKNKFSMNREYALCGDVNIEGNKLFLLNPKECSVNESEDLIIPIYALTEKLKNNTIIKLMNQVLSQIKIEENLPQWIIKKYSYVSLDEAIRGIHLPKSNDQLNNCIERLKFQELFTYSLKILTLKEYLKGNSEGISFKVSKELSTLKQNLPFELTKSQSRVIREILTDQKDRKSMNRLVQGDVGSGKTIVAIIAIFNVVKNGYQAAMMAPTEILATQHYEEIYKLLNPLGINVAILSGSLTAKAKEKIKEKLKAGSIDVIVGTHALIEDNVEFSNLGFVVTDEQHRFGVIQRSKLLNKGKNIDVLVMTATPIPRTLALYMYGDLNISTIDELPPGRKKIKTYFINEKVKSRAYRFALEQINSGRQVYIVCPLVEQNEKMDLNSTEEIFIELKEKIFYDVPVAVLHGKMSPKEKEKIMMEFKENKIKALISTTVIEVGVNVPNATIMIIEDAQRFGLAQLHQLRGRVGRGNFESYCILIGNIKNDIIKRRMEIITSSNDGFFIAEEDFKLRGSGQLFGFRQHGDDGLILCDLIEDINLFKIANEEAKKLISSNDINDTNIKKDIMKNLKAYSKFICFN